VTTATRRRLRLALPLLAACAACAACAGDPPRAITGLVDATEIDVASKVPGRVKALAVRAAEKAQAQRALDTARAQAELAKKGWDRASALLATGTITQAMFDDADFKWKAAQDQLAIAQARLELVQLGARSEELEALEALVRQGEGSLAEVRTYGRELSQASPLTGEVAKILVHQGELAATGYPILTLVDRRDAWVTFPVREDLLPGLTVGSTIQVEVPAVRRTIAMTVFQVAPLGDFATWRATGEKARFDLRTFEVRARPAAPEPELRPGMTARLTLAAS
jgi:HlyD family secretion protein